MPPAPGAIKILNFQNRSVWRPRFHDRSTFKVTSILRSGVVGSASDSSIREVLQNTVKFMAAVFD